MERCKIINTDQQYTIEFDFGKNHTITLGRACLDMLGNPKYVRFSFNPETKILIVRNWDWAGYRVFRAENGTCVFTKCDRFMKKAAEETGWRLGKNAKVLLTGSKIREDMIGFNLAEPFLVVSDSPVEEKFIEWDMHPVGV